MPRACTALAPLAHNVTSVSIARHCDCARLCVLRGLTDVKDARRTVREIGAQRFLGSLLFDPHV